jgi:PAS domain S-box-containing protein
MSADRVAQKTDPFETADGQKAIDGLLRAAAVCARPESNLGECLRALLDAAIAISAADKGNIQLLDESDGALKISVQRGFDRPFLDFFAIVHADGVSACGAALGVGSRISVEDVTTSEIFAGGPSLQILLEAGVRAVQSTPLIASDGAVLGMISTHRARPGPFDAAVTARLDLLARLAADYLMKRRADQELRRSQAWLKGQKEAFQASMNGASLSGSLEILVRSAVEHAGNDSRASFFLLRADRSAIRHVAGMTPEYGRVVGDFPVGPAAIGCGLAAYTGKPVICPDVLLDPAWAPYLWLARQFDYRATWSFPVKSDRGEVVGTFCVYCRHPREITPHDIEVATALTNAAGVILARHAATAQRDKAEAIVESHAADLRDMFDAAAVGMTRCSGETMTYLDCNETYASIAGRPRHQIVGHTIEEVMGHEAMELIRPYVEWALRGERVQYEIELPWSAAGPKWIEVNYTPRPAGKEGRVAEWMGTIIDISGRKRAESQLRRHHEELEGALARRTNEVQLAERALARTDRMAAVGTMAAGMAHDIKNILMPLSARVDIVLADSELEGEARTDLAVVVALIDHLREMARNLELFSRDPEQEGSEGTTDLAAWWSRVKGLIESSLEPGKRHAQRWIRINPELPDGLPSLAIAPHRLTQAVLNLVHNARDAIVAAAPGGSGVGDHRGCITVRAEPGPAPAFVSLSVIDDGCGMDVETAHRSVEPFFTTKSRPGASGSSGSGLGLWLARAICDRSGGRLEIESESGKGTTVTLQIPVAGSSPGTTGIGPVRPELTEARGLGSTSPQTSTD